MTEFNNEQCLPKRDWYSFFVFGFPVFYAIFYSVAMSRGHLLPGSVAQAGLLTLVIALLGWMPAFRLNLSRTTLVICTVFLIQIVYQCSGNFLWGKIGGGIWSQISLLLGFGSAVLVYSCPRSSLQAFHSTFIGCGVVVIGCFIACVANGGLDLQGDFRPEFGFGNISFLTNTCGMGVMAWACLLALQEETEGPYFAFNKFMCLVSCIALGLLCLSTGRRASLIMAVAASLITVYYVYRFSPKKIALAFIAISILTGSIILFCYFVGYRPRVERFLIYNALFEIISILPWWGGGDGAASLTRTMPLESCRHLTSASTWFWHSHNEFLECLITGGWPLLIIHVSLWVSIIFAALRIPNRNEKMIASVLLVSLAIVAFTNNTLSTMIGHWWTGIVVGLIVKSHDAAESIQGVRSFIVSDKGKRQLIALSVILPLAIGLGRALPSAVSKPDDSAKSLFAAYRSTIDPESAGVLGCTAVAKAGEEKNWGDALTYGLHVKNRLGLIGDIGQSLANTYARIGDPRKQLEAEIELIAMLPFRARSYLEIDKITNYHPELASIVPTEIYSRAKRVPFQVKSDTYKIDNIDEAADLFISALDDRERGLSSATIQKKLELIAPVYGDVPQVASSVFKLTALIDPPPNWSESTLHTCAKGFGTFNISDLKDINSTEKAKRVAPLLRRWFPQMEKSIVNKFPIRINGSQEEREVLMLVHKILLIAHDVDAK